MIQQSHFWAYYPDNIIIKKDTCAPMFITALFTIVRTQKQPKSPSIEEWITQMWCIYNEICSSVQFSLVQSLSRVQLFATPWIAARQASLSITNSRSSPKPTSIESVMPSSHLILCRPLLLLPSIPPSIRVFSSESTLRMRYSAIKRDRVGSLVQLWMDLEYVIQSEESQKEENKYHILTHICGI